MLSWHLLLGEPVLTQQSLSDFCKFLLIIANVYCVTDTGSLQALIEPLGVHVHTQGN